MDRGNVLFEKQVPILLKLGSDVQKHPSIHTQVSLLTANRSKVLDIQLTDPANPFFLFQLSISEEDFHTLKQDQNLLIDFIQFPSKFIELLDACVKCKDDEYPKFITHLHQEPTSRFAILSILESNSFKQIIHLTLSFIPGNDTSIKEHLASVTKELKTENKTLKLQLSNTEHSLKVFQEKSSHDISRLSEELEKQRIFNTESSSHLHKKYQDDISQDRDKRLKEREEQLFLFEKEKREISAHFENEIKSLNTKVTSLTTTNSHLHSQIQTLEVNLSSATKNLDHSQKEVTLLKSDADKTYSTIKLLEKEKYQMINDNAVLNESLKALSQKANSYQEANIRLEAEIGNIKVSSAILEKSCETLNTEVNELDEALEAAKGEINKGNEIIRKLQAELKASKLKVKLKNTLVLQQEKLLDDRLQTIESQQISLSESKDALEKVSNELSESKAQLEISKKTIEEKTATLHDNTNVIEWLHRQLNDQTLSKPMGIEKSPYAEGGRVPDKYASYGSKFSPGKSERRDDKSSPEIARSSILKSTSREKEDTPALKSKFATSVAANSLQRGLGTRLPLKPASSAVSGLFNANLKSNYF